MAKLHKLGAPKSRTLKVRADSLQPHPRAQRELSPARIKKLVATLDLDAIGVLHVVQYPIGGKDAMWIIDGQHRWRALMEHGFGEFEVEIKIHLDVRDDARASELFLELNDRLTVNQYDKFRNQLIAKEEEAIGMNDIAIKHGLKIGAQSVDKTIAGIAGYRAAFRLDGGVAADKALETICATWGKSASSLEGKMIHGIALVYARHNGNVDRPALVKKLAKHKTASALIGDARTFMELKGGTLTRQIATLVIDTYNSGRRSGKLDPL